MGTKKKALTFLLFAGIMLFTAQSAFGGCEVAGLDALIDVSGNAPGTKLSGPITVYYQKIGDPKPGYIFTADMYLFLRLRKGAEVYQFAGKVAGVDFPNIDADVLNIEEFFEDIVIPALYSGCDPLVDCPNVVLKSYDMDVDWETPGDTGEGEEKLYSFIADIVIAVQD